VPILWLNQLLKYTLMPGLQYFHITNTLEYSDDNRRLGTDEIQIEKKMVLLHFFCENHFVLALEGKKYYPRGSASSPRKYVIPEICSRGWGPARCPASE